ncbi:MAG: sulfotransferase [Candidatus Nitricoxidivorans perseverans]|uniref:Sulfotransferase n=1 Tax=Candidatus Nitricoxidivorans perseverans TaxID=2975601 RepID=A0AA49FLW5_9PROT|nr:MAG: sulfotransferase [Candidatus Nitricoxidivorans perseverans]
MRREAPVFVVGMNGSGTTMLADSLGRHPELFMLWEESKVLPYYLNNNGPAILLDNIDARRNLIREIGETKGFWRTNGMQPLLVPDEYMDEPGVPGVISAIYKYLAAKEGKTRWGDKSPNNTFHIAKLAEAFPVAQFVHIIRDGRDAACSFHRRWKYDPLHTIARWKDAVESGRQHGRALAAGRYIEVFYENLTSSPESEMRKVCDFLGLPFDEKVIESGMPHFSALGSDGKHVGRMVANSGKWQRYFNATQIGKMEQIAGKLLSECGYQVAVRGDDKPGSLRRKYWLAKDGFVYSQGVFVKYGIRVLPRYIRHVKTAMKQWRSNRK